MNNFYSDTPAFLTSLDVTVTLFACYEVIFQILVGLCHAFQENWVEIYGDNV